MSILECVDLMVKKKRRNCSCATTQLLGKTLKSCLNPDLNSNLVLRLNLQLMSEDPDDQRQKGSDGTLEGVV